MSYPLSAGQASETDSPERQLQLQLALNARLEPLEDQLLDTLSTGSPDCGQARSLRDQICSLSDRISQIASRHPGDDDSSERCEDGRDRCLRARRDVGESCGDAVK